MFQTILKKKYVDFTLLLIQPNFFNTTSFLGTPDSGRILHKACFIYES